jgi:hypothetical protein
MCNHQTNTNTNTNTNNNNNNRTKMMMKSESSSVSVSTDDDCSSASASASASVLRSQMMFEQLKAMSRSVHDVVTAAEEEEEEEEEEELQKQRRVSNKRRGKRGSKELVKDYLLAKISFHEAEESPEEDYNMKDSSFSNLCCNGSTVSSLGMGHLDDDDDDEDDLLLPSSGHDFQDEDEEDSVARILTQIKSLRKSSMERFQAVVVTPTKKTSSTFGGSNNSNHNRRRSSSMCDSIPAMPVSQSERSRLLRERQRQRERGDDDDFMVGMGHQIDIHAVTPLDEDEDEDDFLLVCNTARASQRRFMACAERSGSLPSDLSKLMMMTMMIPSSSSSSPPSPHLSEGTDDDTYPSRSVMSMRREDRWSVESSDSLQRDCELVKKAFENIVSSHRSDASETTTTAATAKTTPADKMLVLPVRRHH